MLLEFISLLERALCYFQGQNKYHSNAFHIRVKIEPFDLVSSRIKKEYNSSPKFLKL